MDTRFKIILRPEGVVSPIVGYGIDVITKTITLNGITELEFDMDLPKGTHSFILEFNNKTNETPDMAVIIDRVEFEGIATDRMNWAGLYYPVYPEPWASTQTNLAPVVKHSTYLGWNGRWELPFTTPIFHWIHQLENLGWIYS
jgi:hypothetical protein